MVRVLFLWISISTTLHPLGALQPNWLPTGRTSTSNGPYLGSSFRVEDLRQQPRQLKKSFSASSYNPVLPHPYPFSFCFLTSCDSCSLPILSLVLWWAVVGALHHSACLCCGSLAFTLRIQSANMADMDKSTPVEKSSEHEE